VKANVLNNTSKIIEIKGEILMGVGLFTCPECEGTGKAVDKFDFPIDLSKPSYFIDRNQYRSDGRVFLDCRCPICNGTGIAPREISKIRIDKGRLKQGE